MDKVSIDLFRQLELRTARVVEARPHPNANKLMILRIDVGGEEKQIVSGIINHYSTEEMVGKIIIVVNNLEPAMLRGEESHGMLLAASDPDGRVVLLQPDKPIPAGCGVK